MSNKVTSAAPLGTSVEVPPTNRRLNFTGGDEFYAELKRRVELHMTNNGRRKRDCPQMYLKTAIILTVFVVTYGLLVFWTSSWWQALPLAVLLAFATAAIGFDILHDA
jgi:linoleoyl-CoA desaturase